MTMSFMSSGDPSSLASLRKLPGEGSVLESAAEIFSAPEAWLNLKNPLLGGRSPEECIAAGDEQSVWDLLRSIKGLGQNNRVS
jgi:hypothetical protein